MSTTDEKRTAPSKTEVDDAKMLAKEVGLEYVDLDRYPLNAAAAALIPEQIARRHHALAVGWKYGTPVVAVATPDNVLAMDDVRTIIGRDIHAVVAAGSQIDSYIDRMYRQGDGSGSARGTAPLPPPPPPPPPAAAAAPKAEAAGHAVAPSESQARPAPPPRPSTAPATAPAPPPPPPPRKAASEATPAPESVLQDEASARPETSAEVPTPPSASLPIESTDTPPPPPPKSPAPHAKREPAARKHTPRAAAVVEEDVESVTDEPEEPVSTKPALADLLVESGQVTRDEMEAALRESTATGRALGEILAELGLVTEEDLIRATALEEGLEFVDLNDFSIDTQAVSIIPEALARRHHVLAIAYRSNVPLIAMANPSDVFALDDLRTVIGSEIQTVVCSPGQVNEYIQRLYRHDQETDLAARNAVLRTTASEATQSADITDLQAVTEDAPIVKYVNLILRQALNERASDIHIEPAADDLRIRFRIDGVLHDVTRSPKAIQGGVTTRLKVMASLDIAEHRLPQDGRISLNAGSREIDLRVSTLPTVHGEKIVMRVLDKSTAMLGLGDLGFLPDVLKRYETAYRKPYGTILVTGPTGSGKSTTLYATLNILNSSERNLITVEDPVEYQLRGINQVQVNPKAGLTFASALRSILRSDPDIVLVGEIRDRETAVIAIEAALTGHMVLSSLHTNDAAGTPMRLIEMGVEPFLAGSALDCVVAQRLARQLCDNCSESHEPTEQDLELVGWEEWMSPEHGKPRFRKAVGCQACSRTGYKGRLALHEILLVTEELERLIIARSAAEEIERVSIEQGMRTLRQDGLRKAALGLTSLEEILRVVV